MKVKRKRLTSILNLSNQLTPHCTCVITSFIPKLVFYYKNFLLKIYKIRVATWSEKSGKTKKNYKSQVKTGGFWKIQEFIFLNIRFCQLKFTKFLILKSNRMKKNYLKFFKLRLKLQNFSKILQNCLLFNDFIWYKFRNILYKTAKFFW